MPQTNFASGNINPKFRDIHPSMVDRIDLCSTSNGDPGANGSLVPFCKLYTNLHFSEQPTYMSDYELEEEEYNE